MTAWVVRDAVYSFQFQTEEEDEGVSEKKVDLVLQCRRDSCMVLHIIYIPTKVYTVYLLSLKSIRIGLAGDKNPKVAAA